MATIPIPIVMEFEQDMEVHFKEVKHYNLTQGEKLLSQRVNVKKNRGFSRANYVYSLHTRQGKKWSRQITGLFATKFHNIFHGDLNNKSHLLICQSIDNGKRLRFYLFRNYYTRHLTTFLNFFNNKYL